MPAERGLAIVAHSRTVQGSWTSIRSRGRDGFQWWLLSGCPANKPATDDLRALATRLADGFAAPLPELVAATDPADMQRWVLRDHRPRRARSKGRVAIIGDAAHPTSPYAAYGA